MFRLLLTSSEISYGVAGQPTRHPCLVAGVVRLARTRYAGANHTHLSELLSEREGIDIGRTTLRRILVSAGSQQSKDEDVRSQAPG